MINSDCLFCKIIAGQIPNYTVWENEHVLAFLDIHPCAKGHTVVVSKKHFTLLEEATADDMANVAIGLQAVVKRVRERLAPDAMNIGLNNGAAAGQSVPHAHWHIIPRWENDGGGSLHSIIHAQPEAPVAEVAKLFNK